MALTSYELSGGTMQGTLYALCLLFQRHAAAVGLDPEDAWCRVSKHIETHGLPVDPDEMPPDLRRLVKAMNRKGTQ